MNEEAAQTPTAPTNGASNANDFQPSTRNPQTAPVNLFKQEGGVQNVTNTQELLANERNVQISITKNPAPAQAQVVPTKDATGLVLLAAVAIVVAILLFKISSKLPTKRKSVPAASAGSEAIVSEEVAPTAPKEVIQLSTLDQPLKKKKSSKKSKSKRKHR